MTGAELKRWRQRNKISRRVLGKILGKHADTIRNYENNLTDVEIPAGITLACAAWALGVRQYDGKEIMLLRPIAENVVNFAAKIDFANPMPSVKTAFEKARAAALRPGTEPKPRPSPDQDPEA